VVKRHEFNLIQQKATQARISQTINAALAQAKVHHPNACDILEIQLEIDKTNCVVYHVLEALEGDAEKDIEQRKRSNAQYAETDLRNALLQVASALAYAHSKVSCT
jgi:serine/threonine protein kinase